jgi:cytoskeletal protein CcmA (bactofilin family)
MIGKKPGIGSASGEMASVIGEGSHFDGTLEVTGNLRVDGSFKGKLNVSESITVGKRGQVDAEVNTRNAIVAGAVKGNLQASEKITLQSGSRLEGETTRPAHEARRSNSEETEESGGEQDTAETTPELVKK